MRTAPIALMLTALATLTACDRDALYAEATLSDNVYKAYAECSEAEISFLGAKHNIQTAFENCGSNNFVHFAWAPDGVQLYFQLPMSAHIMNAEDKSAGTMPTEVPIGGVAWLSRELLVLPLGPAEDKTQDRLVLFDRVQASMQTLDLKVKAPKHLMPSGERDQVYFTAEDADGVRGAYVANFTTSEVTAAFPWISEAIGGPLTSFTLTPEVDLVAVSDGSSVAVAKGATGEIKHVFTDAHRGVVHPEGRYVALESWGDPISPFDQRSWDELSPDAREREERRSKEWLERQPDWVVKEINPPVIDIYDIETEQRLRFTAFFGDRFQWYPSPYYASFVLWGLEGKEVNKNVALSNLHERLRMSAGGDIPMGLKRYEGPARKAAKATPKIESSGEGAGEAPSEAPSVAPAKDDTPPAE